MCSSASEASLVLQEVLFVMGARLVQIDERWKDGVVQKAGLSRDEVVHLVRPFHMMCFPYFAMYMQLRGNPAQIITIDNYALAFWVHFK